VALGCLIAAASLLLCFGISIIVYNVKKKRQEEAIREAQREERRPSLESDSEDYHEEMEVYR